MRTQAEISKAIEILKTAARFASRQNDSESYEVLSTAAFTLGWVVQDEGTAEPFAELLQGAVWAAAQMN